MFILEILKFLFSIHLTFKVYLENKFPSLIYEKKKKNYTCKIVFCLFLIKYIKCIVSEICTFISNVLLLIRRVQLCIVKYSLKVKMSSGIRILLLLLL